MDKVESLPVLYVRAKSHYDVGFTIGSTFKDRIRDYMTTSNDVKNLKKFYDNAEGRSIVEDYIANGSKSHKNIVSEVQGMADGADIKFEELFLLQISSEISFCHLNEVLQGNSVTESKGKGCTDVLVNKKQCRVIGHNEDWTKDVSSKVYIVHVTITDQQEYLIEQFVSFCFPGYLAGFCFGMNKSLVITLNSLLPRKANRRGVPLAVLLRALLACSSIEECAAIMESKPNGSAYGMNINIASINETNMCSMEVYPSTENSVVEIKYIPFEGIKDEPSVYFHQNHYKLIAAEELTGPCARSRRRDKRTSELSEVHTIDDVRAILGDTEDQLEPIYRVPDATHIASDVKTSATALFDMNTKLLCVYRSNPKLALAPCLTVQFL